MRTPRLGCIAVSVAAAGFAPAASLEDRIEQLFRPPLAAMATLSSDGQRVAYTAPSGGELTIVTQLLEPLGPRRTHRLDPPRTSSSPAPVASVSPPPSTALRFLRWATPNRLVYAPAVRVTPLPPLLDAAGQPRPNPDGPAVSAPIYAVDADGRHHGLLVDARHFTETPAEARTTLADLLKTSEQIAATRPAAAKTAGWRMPHVDILGFHPREPDQLIVATRGAYSVPTQHLVDIRTASVREFGDGWPAPSAPPLVFDWFRLKPVGERRPGPPPSAQWHDPELARLQSELDARFPRRAVELLDWSDHRTRVLFRVTGGTDPGRLFVLQRPEEVVLELTRLAPWLKPAQLHDTRPFAFAAPDGTTLGGYLTWPAKPRAPAPPLLVVFASGHPGLAHAAWDPEAQVYADLGYAVARLHHRAASGIRESDAAAFRAAPDRVSVDDARAAVEWLAQPRGAAPVIDRRRVAALGRGFGGYLAVRAVQLRPGTFRSAVALDAPLDLPAWLRSPVGRHPAETGDPAAALRPLLGEPPPDSSALAQADAPAHPLLLLVEPSRDAAVDTATAAFRARHASLGGRVEHAGLDPGFAAGLPAARAAVYRRIESFLAAALDRHDVKLGPVREVP